MTDKHFVNEAILPESYLFKGGDGSSRHHCNHHAIRILLRETDIELEMGDFLFSVWRSS